MRTVALLLTDIEGSTLLWQEAPDAMDAAMARHHDLIAAAVDAHGGWRPVDQGEGDSTFLAFDSAVGAVAAALELQRAFAREAWPTQAALSVRAGVHVGEVIIRNGNLFGETVNRCARIRGIGHGGQTLLSTAAYELVRDGLPDGASLQSLGEHRLRDLVRPERLWQLDHPDLPAEFPPLTSLNRGRHNLPVQLTSFVGRDTEKADLAQLLVEGTRLLTVTGFGGMGKTRLALAVAAELVDGTGDGVWFVDLAGVFDPAAVPREIAEVLGARDTGQGMVAAVLQHLESKRLLLVLDNLEQVSACAPFIARLLAEAPGVQVLGTSRTPLGLRGEKVYGLEPFPPPQPSTQAPPDGVAVLSTYAAVTLFIDRARDARRGFAVDDGNAAAVAAICSRLDGVPLAIELAAARVAALSPAALLTRLEQSLGVLSGHEHDRPERHRTVRATVAWSYDLLTSEEQALLNRLSMLPGTAGLAAVEVVCDAAPAGPSIEVFPVLASLVDKSLVRRSEQDGEPRYSLLESVRDFASEQLPASARDALAQAHQAHYLSRSVSGAATDDGPDEQPWYDEMYRDAHHFRAALGHAEASGRAGEHLLLAANLFDLWGLGGHRLEGLTQLVRAKAAAAELSNDLALVAFATCAEAWLSAASDAESSRALAQRSVMLAERSGDLTVMSFAHQVLGFSLADRLAAREANERAVALAGAAREAESPIRWGSTRPEAVEIGASLWLVAFHRWSDPALARERARTLRQRAADARRDGDVAYVDYRMGELAADIGDLATATSLFERAVEVFEHRHDDLYVAHGVLARARVQVRAERDPVESLVPLISRYRNVANTNNLEAAELLLGDLQAVSGDLGASDAAYRRAAALHPDGTRASWRLLRFDRLAGRDTRADLEELYRLKRTDWRWHRPDLLGCLVEAAVTAERYDDPDRAGLLTGTVKGMRGDFLLPEVILADLAELSQRHTGDSPSTDLPESLFGRAPAAS